MMMMIDIWDRALRDSLMTPNEIRELIGLEPVTEPKRITNCKNCGAPLTENGLCEYCRTQY